MNMNSMKLNRQKNIDDKAEVIMVPADITPNIASNAMVPLKPMEIIVSSMAGAMVMSMS